MFNPDSSKVIFISHSSVDKAIIREWIVDMLSNSHRIFWDIMLLAGQSLKLQLQEAIQKSDIVIFVMSPESLASEWCIWEIQEACRQNKPIIPIKLRRSTPPKWLENLHFIDFSAGRTPEGIVKLSTAIFNAKPLLDPIDPAEIIWEPKGLPTNASDGEAYPNHQHVDMYRANVQSAVSPKAVQPALNEEQSRLSVEAQRLYELAGEEYDAGRYEQAISYLDQALNNNPRFALAYNRRGACYYALNKVQKAKTDYETALSIEPDLARALHNMGLVAEQLGNLESAIQWYTKAIQSNEKPYAASALYCRGRLAFNNNRMEDAISDLQQSIKLSPDFSPAHYLLSQAFYYGRDNMKLAIEEADRAVRLLPNNYEYLHWLAGLLYDDGQYYRSIEVANQAINVDSRAPFPHFVLANALYKMGHYNRAKSEVLFAMSFLETDVDRATYQMLLGQIEEKLGHNFDALTAYKKAVQLDPTNTKAQNLLRQLRDQM